MAEPLEYGKMKRSKPLRSLGKVVAYLAFFYLFLVSVKLMGDSLNVFGHGLTQSLMRLGRSPYVCLFIGIFATSVLQSSGLVTSMIVVWGQTGMLPLEGAIAMVMGANIGTTVTNLLVSLSMVTRSDEFRRAFAGAVIHDFVNVFPVLIFFPLELATGFLRWGALHAAAAFQGAGGGELVNIMDLVVTPVARLVLQLFLGFLPFSRVAAGIVLLTVAVGLLFASLILITRLMRRTVLKRLEVFFDRYLFRNAAAGLVFGLVITVIVRSSSVSTSLIVPLAGAGVLTVEQIFPYTLGANVGTTFSAMLAALVRPGESVPGTTVPLGLTIAFSHFLFNILGIIVIYPFRSIPIAVSKKFGELASRNKSFAFLYIGIAFFVIPGIIILVSELLK